MCDLLLGEKNEFHTRLVNIPVLMMLVPPFFGCGMGRPEVPAGIKGLDNIMPFGLPNADGGSFQ